MLERHKQFSKMIGKLSKAGLGKKGFGGMDVQQLMRNPNQLMQNMQKSIDPRILKQMGGTQNMMKMMKELGKMDGMMDMQELMRGMSGSR